MRFRLLLVIVLMLLFGCQSPGKSPLQPIPEQYKKADILAYQYSYPKITLSVWDFGCTYIPALKFRVQNNDQWQQLTVYRPSKEACYRSKTKTKVTFDLSTQVQLNDILVVNR